ncbi:UNVERIFIED_ORG: hypothetical protein J2W38_006766 [Variovorax paradoxus]|nr:hypothetical protein [Variovorax paradoxus]
MTPFNLKIRIADVDHLTLTNRGSAYTQVIDSDGQTMVLGTFSEEDFELWCSELQAAKCKFVKVAPG